MEITVLNAVRSSASEVGVELALERACLSGCHEQFPIPSSNRRPVLLRTRRRGAQAKFEDREKKIGNLGADQRKHFRLLTNRVGNVR